MKGITVMKEISVEELKLNPSTLIGKEWALLTAGNKDAIIQ